MSKVKIVLNYAGVGKMLKSTGTKDMIEGYGMAVANAAGAGYATRSHYTEQRVIVNVYADSEEAHQDNLNNNTLLKSMGAV